jgi:UDP-N-acetylglucosamine:LPS N-acetylglucosamine transferase
MTAALPPRVLGVSSPGSRWAELKAIALALGAEDAVLVRAANSGDTRSDSPVVTDFSLFSFWNLPACVWQLGWLMARHRPQLVISTGAAPGVLALVIGKVFGARCVWVESLTSTEHLSLSGRIAGWFADLWLTQWPELATPRGPYFRGSLL